MAIENLGGYAHKPKLAPNTTAPAQARTSFAGPGGTFPDGDAEHARLAISGATHSEHAGNITPEEEATIKSKARKALGSYKMGPVKGPIADVRKKVVEHSDVHPPAKALIIAELGRIAGNGNTHAEVSAHSSGPGDHHVSVKPRADLSSAPGGKFGYPATQAPPMMPSAPMTAPPAGTAMGGGY